jgi:transitional endoplasmic reticulum ATPase
LDIRVTFRRTGSPAFTEALELARAMPSFRESQDRPREFSVSFSQDQLEGYDRLIGKVGGWANTRLHLNGQPVERERLDGLLACYRQRLQAPDRRAYCAGAAVHETRVGPARQLFPCRMIPISEGNHRGWFQFGRLTRERVFVVDKGQLRQAVNESLQRSLAVHCPALFPAEIDNIIDRLPDRIDPKSDPQWIYKEGWHNGQFVPVGVEKRGRQSAERSQADRSPAALVHEVGRSAKPGATAAQAPTRAVPTVRWRDIGGLGPQIKLVRENLELPLRYPGVFERLGVQARCGLLLSGPPGTGKTLIAKALASECNAHLCLINGPEVLSKWHGESEANLRRVFEEARDLQPSVVLIDEIDSIAPDRGRVSHSFEAVLVSQLLSLMDGLYDRGRVIVVATTNRPEHMDAALRRPGRFDLHMEIGLPDAAGREEILRIHTRSMPLLGDVDLTAVAAECAGFCGADLAALCREAGMECMRDVLEQTADGDLFIDPEIVPGLAVGAEHFRRALGQMKPRS